MNGIGAHHRGYQGASDEWLTPPAIIEALGAFDLDPCSPVKRPWDTAARHLTIEDDGLAKPWVGRVWLNPPYGPQIGLWLAKLAVHGDGIALLYARTETDAFFETVWSKATAVLFLRGRLHFHYLSGERASANCGGPSVLVAYGSANAIALAKAGIGGVFLELTPLLSSSSKVNDE